MRILYIEGGRYKERERGEPSLAETVTNAGRWYSGRENECLTSRGTEVRYAEQIERNLITLDGRTHPLFDLVLV